MMAALVSSGPDQSCVRWDQRLIYTILHASKRVAPFVDKPGSALTIDWRVLGRRFNRFVKIASHQSPQLRPAQLS
jgi:hypothetical protein